MTIGINVKEARKRMNLTQKQLADKLGVSQAMIAQYENGLRNPKIETLEKIAEALNISIGDLMDVETVTYGDYVFAGTSEACKQFEFISKFKNSKDGQILKLLDKLNDTGQNKALEQVELLTKIPEYRKDKQLTLNAAHDLGATEEQKAHADSIMEDDSEWE